MKQVALQKLFKRDAKHSYCTTLTPTPTPSPICDIEPELCDNSPYTSTLSPTPTVDELKDLFPASPVTSSSAVPAFHCHSYQLH